MKRLVSGFAAISPLSKSSLLFFDASVPAIADLARHSLVETRALSGAVDPLVEISRQLNQRALETLHIVAHGGSEFILIGNTIITSDKLRQHAALLQHWQVSEILLWSCSVGARSQLVQTLSELTGATVYASDRPLGMTVNGPNWTLGSGEQARALPFVTEAAQQWPHQLVALLFSSQAYFAEDSAAPGSAKADLEENSLKLTALVAPTAMKYLLVSEPPGDPVYSGNNVHGTLYAIDGNDNVLQSYFGEISRLVKSGSTVQAAQFYVYPNPSDPTNTGSPARTILIDLATGGKFAVGNTIGTSSDPVDAALNKLIPVASAPIAYADNGEVHLATCASDVDTAETATPTGNVITGRSTTGSASTADSGYITSWSIDTTPNPDKLVSSVSGLAVSNVKSNATGSLSVVNSGSSSTTGAATIQGKYGVLKIGADGSYSYDADETNADLMALSSAAGSYVNEVFTYTVLQAGTGKTATSTLTIRIDGGNDDPTAGNDYVFVNEGTAARPVTLASTTSTAGAVLADNLLSNDRDPDTGDAIKIIKAEQATSLTDETFSASAVNVTSSGVSTFSRTIGFTYSTVEFGTSVSEAVGTAVYIVRAGTTTAVDSGATLTAKGSGPTSKQATFSAALNLAEGDIIRFGSSTATNYTIGTGGLITASQTHFKLTGSGSAPSVGADVTGPGVPNGTKVTAVDGSLVMVNQAVSLTGTGLDSGESLSFVSGAIHGTYGYLDLKSDGTYKYVLTADVPDNTTKDEYFTYQIEDKDHCTDTAVLHVRIEGHQVSYPSVSLKSLTVDEVGASSGSLAAVAGADIALVSGNGEFVSTALSTHASDTVVQVGTTAGTGTNQPVHGQYGTLTMNADGKWSYLLDNGNLTVDALRTSADKLYETFEYRVQNSVGQDDVSTITITIQGANDAPIASNDSGKAIEAGGLANGTSGVAASGNLFANDTDVDHGDTKTLQGFGVSSIGSLGSANPAGEYSLSGAHGTLYVKADGTWRYVVDENDTVIDALSADQTEKDTFVYRVVDTAGATSDATLEVTIQGSNDSVAVNDVEVNEASSHAVFTITGHAGQEVTLQLAQTGAGVNEATLGDTADAGTTLGTGLEYYNGSQWVPYNLTTDKVTLDDNGQLYVRTAIHQDDTHEGLESFLLYVTTTDGQASVGTGSISDEAKGVKYVFDPKTGLPSTENTNLDDDRAITVTGDTYNEGSPVAVFTIETSKGRTFTLDVQDAASTGKNATGDDGDLDALDGNASGDSLDAADVYYSLDNGATWLKYTSGDSVTAGDYPVLASVDITNEGDDVYEGEEQFKLIVTSDGKAYSGYSSIIDDGSGKLLDVDGSGHPIVDPNGDLTLDTTTTPDDDRGITVTGGTYNEGSPRAVFTVTATAGQSLTLDVRDVAASGKDATGPDAEPNDLDGDDTGDALDQANLYYSLDGGHTWTLYTGAAFTAGSEPVLVAVDISNETDDVYEGEEQFQLVVIAGGNEYSGHASIIDDGSGDMAPVILDGTDLGTNPYTGGDLGGTKDDDRPVDPPPAPFTADLDPATDTGEFDRITQDTEPEFTLNGGTYLQPGGTAQLLDPNGNVPDSTLITAEDIARGTVNLAPGFLDDGVYTYTARILDANGNLVAEAPVTVTVVTDRDGVMPSVELAANGGDFNHDGILDWLQNNVTQLPLSSCEAFAAGKSAPEHCFGAIMAGNVSSVAPGSAVQLDAGAQLLNVRIDAQPKPLPQRYKAETPLMDFTVQSVDGGQLADVAPERAGLQTRIVIDLQPGGARANTYLKWDAAAQDYYEFLDDGDLSTYDDGATLLDLNGDGLIDRIVVTLTDGARGDEDGVVNGTIVDPGLLALNEPDPVYSVLLKNGDRFYTTSAAEAAEMAKGNANLFEGARFDTHDGPDAQKMVAWYNPFTRDWFYGTEEQSPPYKCYVRKSELAGFDSAPAGSDGGDDVHLFVNKKGQTQLVTLDQAAELKLSSKHFVDKGVAFNASTEHAFKFDTEGYLIANHDNAGIQALVASLASKYHSTTSAGFVEAVEQHYLAQAQLVGLPHGDAASAADLNAVFGTHFTA